MGATFHEFHEFEREGWETASVVAGYHEDLGALTGQSVEPLLDAAGVGPGTRVVDVATGPGYVAAAAARRGAEAVGCDFSAAQVALARRLHPDLEFVEGDAMALPFEDASAEAVVSNYGMPHFPDPDGFLREAFRVMRPGGRVAFATWASPDEGTGFGIVLGAVREHGTLAVPMPPGPNFFEFSTRERCEQGLRSAGFEQPTFETLAQTWRLSSADGVLDGLVRGTVRTRALIRGQYADALDAIRAAVREAVRIYERDGVIELPMPAVVAAARRP